MPTAPASTWASAGSPCPGCDGTGLAMSGFLFAFVAIALASIGARDQLLLARMSQRQGQRPGLLIIAILTASASCAAAVWVAQFVAGELPTIPARIVFAGLALVFAGGEALLLGARKPPEEPTQSLFAALVVLLAQQITDAARFVVVALTILTRAPLPVALGSAAASALMLAVVWTAPEVTGQRTLPWVRRLAGAVLFGTGLLLIWQATA